MAKLLGPNARLYIAGYDISAIVAGVTPERNREFLDYAVMDGGLGYHHFPLLGKDSLKLDALFDDSYTAVLQALRSDTAGYQVIIPFGTTQGATGLAVNAGLLKNLTYKAVTTELNRISADILANDYPWDEVLLMHPAATRTTSSEGTAINNSTQSTGGLIGYMQYWDLGANDTLAISIQQSSDNGVGDAFADKIAFTALDGAVLTRGAERKTVSGNIEQYLRVAWVFGGTPTYSCTFIVVAKRG